MKIAPSLLACDFRKMGEEIMDISQSGADFVHLDIMDGCFVPNISFGPAVVQALRPCTELLFDVHLMIDHPLQYVEAFKKAGADFLTFHVEASGTRTEETIQRIRKFGMGPGLSVKPSTPVECVLPYLHDIEIVLIMTVEPGFGGQVFMEDMMDKVKMINGERKRRGLNTMIEVDGGINPSTIVSAARSGVDVCVAGTSVFHSSNRAEAIKNLKQCALISQP